MGRSYSGSNGVGLTPAFLVEVAFAVPRVPVMAGGAEADADAAVVDSARSAVETPAFFDAFGMPIDWDCDRDCPAVPVLAAGALAAGRLRFAINSF